MTRLSETIRELTEDHAVNIGTDHIRLATEAALLDQLEDAKAGTATGGGAVNRQTAPLGIDPLVIEQDIIRTIHTTSPIADRYGLASMSLKPRVATWGNLIPEALALAHLQDWVGRIRALFLHYQDLDAPCPRCGFRYVLIDEGDQVIRQAALVVCKETLTASCRNWECGAVWSGVDELHNLAATT